MNHTSYIHLIVLIHLSLCTKLQTPKNVENEINKIDSDLVTQEELKKPLVELVKQEEKDLSKDENIDSDSVTQEKLKKPLVELVKQEEKDLPKDENIGSDLVTQEELKKPLVELVKQEGKDLPKDENIGSDLVTQEELKKPLVELVKQEGKDLPKDENIDMYYKANNYYPKNLLIQREHQSNLIKPIYESVCVPKFDNKIKPTCKQICDNTCRPKCKLVCKSPCKLKFKACKPICESVCESKFKEHQEYYFDNYKLNNNSDYIVDCKEKNDLKYTTTPIKPQESIFRMMINDDFSRKSNKIICKPRCEPVSRHMPHIYCKPRCEYVPRSIPMWGNNCKPRFIEDYKPQSKIICRPKCDSILKKHKKRRRRREIKQDIGLYIRLIRQVLLQGGFEVNKLARCFSEEIKTKLLEGFHLILKSTGNKFVGDLKKLEQRIADVVIFTTKNVLRDTEAVITNTNENILDNLRANVRTANKTILGNIAALVTTTATPIQPLNSIMESINSSYSELLVGIPIAFKKLVQEENTAFDKIVNDNRNEALREVAKLIEEFEQKLSSHLMGLMEEEIIFVRNIVDQATKKLLVDLQHILHQIGEGIIVMIKGRNYELRPLLFGIQTEFGWNNLDDDQVL